MASMCNDPRGRKRILFVDSDGSRKTIRLGRHSQKQAESIKVRVEHLIAAKVSGRIDPDVLMWIAELPDDIHARIAAVGLLAPRSNSRLKEFLDAYMAGRTDIKPQTAVAIGHTIRNLLAFFRADKALATITTDDALGFRAYLVEQGLSEATTRRRIGVAKQFFFAAMEKGLVHANPFKSKKLPCTARGNRERQFFVTREVIDRVLENCPDCQWRAIVSSARYGGLRTPSEVLRLRWSDVDWDKGRLTIHSPKTERHAGHETREVPLFPELREHLMQVFEAAEPGSEWVITRYRLSNLNLRQQFGRILAKAGVKPWPRLFQNLRSSRQTELCSEFPEFVVCSWMGNSKLVAREHYEQVRDTDFERAVQSAQKAAHGSDGAQKKAQQPAAVSCTEPQPTPREGPENADLLVGANCCKSLQDKDLGPVGFEPTTKWL